MQALQFVQQAIHGNRDFQLRPAAAVLEVAGRFEPNHFQFGVRAGMVDQ